MLGLRSLVRPACAASGALRRTVVPQSMQGMAAPLKRRLSSAMVHDLTSSLSSLSLRSSTRAISAHRDPHACRLAPLRPCAAAFSTQAAPAAAADLPPNLVLADASLLEVFSAPKPPVPEVSPPTSFELKVEAFAGSEGAEAVGTVTLDPRVFGVPIRKDLIHQVITWQRAKRRCGLAATKRPSELRGSTKKARPQKGSGSARAGKKRAPQWRGGYKPHGPRQRDFGFKLNRKVRALGLRVALSAKFLERNVVIVDRLDTLPDAKTRLVAELLEEKDWGRTLFIDNDEVDSKLKLAVQNLQAAHALPQIGANVLDVVKAQTLVISRSGLEALTARLTRRL